MTANINPKSEIIDREELENRFLYAMAQGTEASFNSLVKWLEENYVPKPRVIETADELDNLPVGAVFMTCDHRQRVGKVTRAATGKMLTLAIIGDNGWALNDLVAAQLLPVTVLWEGGE